MTQLAYLKQGQTGQSSWWSWGSVFWLTMIGWIIMQSVALLILVIITSITHPEIARELTALSLEAQAVPPSTIQKFLSRISFFATIFGFLSFLIFMTTYENTKKITGIIAAILIPISIMSVLTYLITSNGNSAELSDVVSQMMGASPFHLGLFLLSFPASLIALYAGQKLIHKRTITSLHTAFKRFRFARALQGFLVIWGVLAIATFIAKALGAPVNYIFDSKRFWGFMIVSLLFIPLQSATEEIIFRGYFNQALGHYINNKWVVFTLTSLAFMALHLSNPEALEGADKGILPIVMSGYFLFGFAACILVLIDDGLESAIGMHAGNNTFAAIFVNYEGSVLPTPSIWQTVPNPTQDAIGTIITLAAAVVILYYLRQKRPAGAV